ncbi:winged helix-turn-helix transcriptional regulator [Kribbella sp. NPDC051586]|uniref:winged helix-turn-helix transcriptional regulator n=1 Tax=Kribbella sp. NPDC051586 TaxID=3364118 RepID=UPI00378CADD4
MEEVKRAPSRSYQQFCGLARALDAIGDRWSLLIVRELLPGPQRYGELAASLDGIATNLLADRLRSLESTGIIERRPGRTRGVVYSLTPWGAQLREPVESLVRWSAPLMATGRREADMFHPRWLAVALPALLHDKRATRPVELGIQAAGLFLTLRIDKTGPRVTLDPDARPTTTLTADPEDLIALAARAIPLDEVLARSPHHGNPKIFSAVFG